jgi:polyisoprenoid-binding protein YceI
MQSAARTLANGAGMQSLNAKPSLTPKRRSKVSPVYRFRWALLQIAVLCAVAMTFSGSTCAATRAQSWRIDGALTWIGFKIDAVGFPTTHGHFAHYRVQVRLNFDRPAKSFTTFTVESASVDVGSLAFNDFVKSAALLDVERFPTMNFTSTQVEKLDAHTARVTGNLTLLGVTKPMTLTVNVESEPLDKGGSVTFVAKGTIMRSDFGMKFGVPLIDDALEITVKTRAVSDD